MKRDENKSLQRSIIIFFILLTIISLTFYGLTYYTTIKNYNDKIKKEMELFIYSNEINKGFTKIEFETHSKIIYKKLTNDGDNLSCYFRIKNNKSVKVSISVKDYEEQKSNEIESITINYIMLFIANLTFSIILSGFILEPIRRNVKITEEFIKDILHDINTPLSIIQININLLERELKGNVKIERIKSGMNKITFLQKNLKDYQLERQIKKEKIDLEEIMKEKIFFFKSLYQDITFELIIKEDKLILETSKDIFTRVLDNIISNACKYNKKNGKVLLTVYKEKIEIIDEGIGIKDTKKVFNRLYKENERGMGLGLNIVKKMINEIGMSIEIISKVGKGTKVIIFFFSKIA